MYKHLVKPKSSNETNPAVQRRKSYAKAVKFNLPEDKKVSLVNKKIYVQSKIFPGCFFKRDDVPEGLYYVNHHNTRKSTNWLVTGQASRLPVVLHTLGYRAVDSSDIDTLAVYLHEVME